MPTRARGLLVTVVCATAACSLNFDYLRGDSAGGGVDGSIVDASGDDATNLEASAHDATDNDSSDGGTSNAGDSAADDAAVDDSGEASTGPVYDPALPPDAATVPCPVTIEDALGTSDPTQTGRTSRLDPASVCGSMAKSYPTTAADPTNLHFFRVYRFANPADASATCFTLNLTYDAASPQKYMTAYSTFYPGNLGQGWLGDVGATLISPQALSVTVPAGQTVDIVVIAIDTAPGGANTADPDGSVPIDGGPGAFVLTCTAQ